MKKLTKTIYEWIEAITVSLIIFIYVFTLVFNIISVDGASMENTLHSKERMIIMNINYEPKKGDIVVISRNKYNETYDEQVKNSRDKTPIIKRVIATEGDTINIIDGDVFINTEKQTEKYLEEGLKTVTRDMEFPITIKHGEIFVMGDNRNFSMDSRDSRIGVVETKYILGKAILRIFPFDKIKTF